MPSGPPLQAIKSTGLALSINHYTQLVYDGSWCTSKKVSPCGPLSHGSPVVVFFVFVFVLFFVFFIFIVGIYAPGISIPLIDVLCRSLMHCVCSKCDQDQRKFYSVPAELARFSVSAAKFVVVRP